MKKIAAVLFVALASLLAFSTQAWALGFSGEYAIANWTVNNFGTPPAAFGSVNTLGAPNSVQLLGGNNGAVDANGCTDVPCRLEFVHTAVAGGTIGFHFSYSTSDTSPQFDRFGTVLNGVLSQLSNNGGSTPQSGNSAFIVSPTDVFGFYIDCTDCVRGAATVTISDSGDTDLAATPEPGTLVLFGTTLAGMVATWRRHRRQ